MSLFLLGFFFQFSIALFLSAYTITSSCKTISQSFSAQLRLQTKYLLLTYKGSSSSKKKKQQQKTKSMAYACRIGLQFNCNFDPIMFVWSFCFLLNLFFLRRVGGISSSSLTGVPGS